MTADRPTSQSPIRPPLPAARTTPGTHPPPAEHEQVCLHCGYTMLGLSPNAPCPECGSRIRVLSLSLLDGRVALGMLLAFFSICFPPCSLVSIGLLIHAFAKPQHDTSAVLNRGFAATAFIVSAAGVLLWVLLIFRP